MKILFYGINYHPESIGIGKYSTEMCEWLANEGHAVEVITSMPWYPHWRVMEPYRKKGWHTEIIKKVKVHRSPLYVPSVVTGKSRIIHEISFVMTSLVYWARCLFKKYDVVICVAPPMQLGLAGIIYQAVHRTVFVFHIQDLQLDAAKQLGLIKSKTVLKLLSGFEKTLLSRARFVSTISEGMRRSILSKGISSGKVIDLKNWIDTKQMLPQPPDQETKESFGVRSNQKVVLYSGNIGEKQGMDTLIEVATELKGTDIVFVVIGDGVYKKKLEQAILQLSLTNVRLYPLQPSERVNKVLNIANLHLVLQKKAAADLVMPSKLTTILSVGGVALVTAEPGTTLYDIIMENKIAIIVEPEDTQKLKDSIVENIGKDLTTYKQNARKYAETFLEKTAILKDFETFLKKEVAELQR